MRSLRAAAGCTCEHNSAGSPRLIKGEGRHKRVKQHLKFTPQHKSC